MMRRDMVADGPAPGLRGKHTPSTPPSTTPRPSAALAARATVRALPSPHACRPRRVHPALAAHAATLAFCATALRKPSSPSLPLSWAELGWAGVGWGGLGAVRTQQQQQQQQLMPFLALHRTPISASLVAAPAHSNAHARCLHENPGRFSVLCSHVARRRSAREHRRGA